MIFNQELVRPLNDFVVNALLLSFMVDAHVDGVRLEEWRQGAWPQGGSGPSSAVGA